MTFLPVLAHWVLVIRSTFSAGPLLLYMLAMSFAFGTLAVIPNGFTGGLNILPAPVFALFLCARVFLLRRYGFRRLLSSLMDFRSGGWLFVFGIYAVVLTLFAPRFFAGEILVTPMNVTRFMQIELLMPSKQNFSQVIYLSVSIFAVLAVAIEIQKLKHRSFIPRIFLFGGAAVVCAGLMDLFTKLLRLEGALEPFRTASYALLTDVNLSSGAYRIVGLMSEASTFGTVSLYFLATLYFLQPAFPKGRQRRLAKVICALLALMVIMSTSSAAYVGIFVFFAIAAFDWMRKNSSMLSVASRSLYTGLFVMIFGVGTLSILALTAPSLFDPIVERVNELLFSKVDSSSYLERSFWSRTAFEAGVASYFFGVGVGSLRGSNILATQFGSFGVIGIVLYYSFVLRMLIRPVPQHVSESEALIVKSMRYSFFPSFAVALLIGTSADFGLHEALRWGVLLALTSECAVFSKESRRGFAA